MPEPQEPEQTGNGFALALFVFYERRVKTLELLAQYVIPLDPRTKKNHMTIAGTGPKCPKCGKRRKQFVRQGAAHSKYAFESAQYLNPRPKVPIDGQIHIVYVLYMQTKRRVDDLNLYASLDDILVHEKILTDDSIKYIRNRDGSRVLYDKENPRAEIYIYRYAEEEDTWLKILEQRCSPSINSLVLTSPETETQNLRWVKLPRW
jgi:hypothetical protein